ncbi:MAG: SusC/RagA family TonB-linked outer membrane protein, partial [Aliifodinibius sp.]|nr:SusC/RagA family TonB-linked outer membrane protein [Fodinibius sp.]
NNKVLSLFNNQKNQVLQSYQGGVSVNATVGQPFGTIQGNDFVYTNGQRTVGSNGYYLKDNKTTDIIGNATPNWTGGINNSFHYKSFTLSFLIDMRQGGSVFSL